MTQTPTAQRLALWQPIRIEQTTAAHCFAIDVSVDDLDVGLFIAQGHYDVPRPSTHRGTRTALLLDGRLLSRGMHVQLSLALFDLGAFKRDLQASSIRVYCHRAAAIAGSKRIGLLCSLVPLPVDEWPLADDAMAAVKRAAAHYQARLAEHAVETMLHKKPNIKPLVQVPPEQLAKFQKFDMLRASPAPTFDIAFLAAAFPPGLVVTLSSTDPDVLERSVQRAILRYLDESNPSPRDGWFDAVIASLNIKQQRALVTWVPHRGLPPYPEVRAAAERRLPRAFSSPRRSDVTPPEIGGMQATDFGSITPLLFDPSNLDWLKEDQDFSFGFDVPKEVAKAAKDRLRAHGFECTGWYQPHHFYTEDTWGIYIDARRLDEIACSIAEDLRAGGLHRGHKVLAAKLALMLVYQHEHFHAKVEAALTWLELQALTPKFRPYKSKVYDVLRGTDEHLEEALANFASWVWISADAVAQQLTGWLSADDRKLVERVIQYHLDLSPPGYRRWVEGEHREIWRTLATQMAQGMPKRPSLGIGLPIEPMLRETLPFDYIEWQDVPCRFVGRGQLASSLLAAPATLNLPQRQEVRNVIQRHFGYELIQCASKGSHEKFRHADGRMFLLSKRDPLSMTVFDNFLEHFKLSKHEYNQIRMKV